MPKTPQHLLDKIERAKREQATTLDLARAHHYRNPYTGFTVPLWYIPHEVFELEHLQVLDLSHTAIHEIPDEIIRLKNLRELRLFGCPLRTLPQMAGLAIDYALYKRFAGDIDKSRVAGLRFRRWEMADFENVTHFGSLTTLDLSYNELTNLPEALAQLSQLTTLDLSENELTNLPEALAQLSQLTSLSLHNNQLSSLPAGLVQLQNIEQIDLKKREGWDIAADGEITLGGNPIEEPPLAIIEKGMAAVRDYFAQKEKQGHAPLYEAKLLLVGEGGAGKTSLWKKLQDETYPVGKQEEPTKGINVHSGWAFDCAPAPGGQFVANLWDFGGQEIQYLTHQFFLTSRSLYVLVADDRKQDTHYEYWFEIIKSLGSGSPVLVVLNERKGQPVSNFDYGHYQREYGKDFTFRKCEVDLAEEALHRFRHRSSTACKAALTSSKKKRKN